MSQEEAWLLQEKYHGEKTVSFFTDCERLRAGEPLAYVIGHIPFLGCQIWLDSHPLIPRPETEYWVEKAIPVIKEVALQRPVLWKASMDEHMLAAQSSLPASPPQQQGEEQGPGRDSTEDCAATKPPHSVLDLCAGSGCIGVAVAKHIPNTHVTFAEIDPAHLPTIEKNCRENLFINRKVLQSDLFKNVTGSFDFILSNPPYIDPAIDRTQRSVKAYEPHRALYGGVHGSELIERIIKEAPAHLNPGGQLWLEHEPEQAELIAALSVASGFTVSTLPDQYGILRYSQLVLQ